MREDNEIISCIGVRTLSQGTAFYLSSPLSLWTKVCRTKPFGHGYIGQGWHIPRVIRQLHPVQRERW